MDPNRLQVNTLVLHHAVTPLWSDKSKAWLVNWFSDNGFARAYGSNPANWSGLLKPNGQRSYSQAHYAGQRVTSATPDATAAERAAGYRLVPLIKDPMKWITWHAGHWNTNQRSIGIENLGDYRNYTLRDGDCKVIADFWRPIDTKLNGNTTVLLHNEVFATQCPARIAEKRSKIVSYINNAPKPAPIPNVSKYEKISPTEYEFIRDASLYDFNYAKLASMKKISSFKKGDRLAIVGKAIHRTGSVYLMTAYSFGKADSTGKPAHTNGVNQADVKVYEKDQVVTKTERITETTPFLTDAVNDPDLPIGEVVVDTKGQNRVVTHIYTVTYTNGKETARKLDRTEVVQEMIVEVVRLGSKIVEEPTPLPVEPVDGETAHSWLGRLLSYVLELLKKFTFKK